MTFIHASFEWAGELYARWFGEWFHIHFLIRTVMVLLALWLVIFVGAQLLRFVIVPLALLFYYHVIFRAWNYIFVETPHEWIYIRHYSKDSPKYQKTYLRLCDKVKRNRLILSHTKYRGLVVRLRRPVAQLMIICAVIATLWGTGFGLHVEYAAPVAVVSGENENGYENGNGPDEYPEYPRYLEHPEYPNGTEYPESPILPAHWRENSTFVLNEQGRTGARLRDGPGIDGHTVIEILWDDAVLFFLNSYVPDEYVRGLFWLRVETQDGTAGYISSALVEVYQ